MYIKIFSQAPEAHKDGAPSSVSTEMIKMIKLANSTPQGAHDVYTTSAQRRCNHVEAMLY